MLRLQLWQEPFFVTFQLGGRAAKLKAPGNAAAGLYRRGFGDIGGVHQQTRCHLEGVKTGVRLLHHLPGDFQGGIADINTVAGF